MKKILIYDSGVGGRAVYHLLAKQLQDRIDSKFITLEYFGDTAHFPYGTKTKDELREIVSDNLQKFEQDQYDVIAVACNTASIVIDELELAQNYNSQLITIIDPTTEKLTEHTHEKIIIIGSVFTISSEIYSQSVISEFPDAQIVEQAEQDLIQLIEEKKFPEMQVIISRIIHLIESGETLVLGCTHFSLVKELFLWEIDKQGKDIKIVDPAEELAKKIIEQLDA